MALPEWLEADPRIRHHHHRPATAGVTSDFPEWVDQEIRDAWARVGVTRLWRHQALAAEAAFSGRHVALATGTASGKTLAYLLPVLAATVSGRTGFATASGPLGIDRGHSALYLAPTKALAHDQLRVCRTLGLPGWQPVTLDGDSEAAERRFARDFGGLILSNPDMLHRAVLPNHQQWVRLLASLRYVVIDEAHRYRGVFGAQVSAVLRRLRRLANHYGADPVFISASATVSGAGELLTRLAGVEPVVEIATDDSARPSLDYLLWQPEEDPHHEAADLLARLVRDGKQTLAFTSSRVQAELVALRAQRKAGDISPIESYRGGYLAADRREIEAGLQSGSLRGVACTNALELGVDISGVDAVLTCGFPGTRSALWQQAGRAGRAGRDALGILIARPDPLDAYLCEHPELIFAEPVEQTILHPENPQVLGLHIAAAAAELPVSLADERYFGTTLSDLLDALTRAGHLRQRGARWYWTRPDRPVDAIDLRSMSGTSLAVVESATGRVIGQVDPAAGDRTVHVGAIYLHQGEQWLVTDYQPADGVALVSRTGEGYFTQPQGESTVSILSQLRSRDLGAGQVSFGTVELSSQVTGYLRRDEATGKVWDSLPLDLPQRVLRTQAVWYTLPGAALAGIAAADLPGAAHGAEHTAIGLLPAFAPCDRWDIGGLSTTWHPDTGELTVFVHDGHPGGAGFAERGYQVVEEWLGATVDRLRSCACADGCPACVVSPKCGNGNNPLNKAAAAQLLALLVG
ncbi:DEAD/DEAH box helicase domain-containing protein [Propionicimonas paludicola]|uniref:DEAD/DEAH box helicase domain-containing protein n=1 Tax=Propionicimonas paludicola TaxID=185243 RepID=A0A2A9CTH5_9ACTN|nr:DEAD/DEAH box helicase [Propionicimonas paludicola]PFG17753.1 DEAD/DEAH box helicase domain-containing protein [Propionicimonas paludicola]